VAAVLVLHVLFATAVLPALRQGGAPFLGDGDPFLEIARNLAQGQGYAIEPGPHPTLRRMPAYPVFLAGLLRMTGGQERAAAVLQVLLVAAAAAFAFATLRRMGPLAASGAALAVGLHPMSMVYSSRFYSEALSIFFSTAALYFLSRSIASERLRHHFGFCLALAGAWLTRTTILLWAVPSLVLLALLPPFRRRPIAWLAGPAVAVALAIPWIARNHAVTGEWTADSTWNARSALHGALTTVDPRFTTHSRELDQAAAERVDAEVLRVIGPIDSGQKELQEDRFAMQWFFSELLAHPFRTIKTFARGLVRSFYVTSSRPVRILSGLANLALIALALLSWHLGRYRGPRPFEVQLWLLVGSFWLFHSLVFPVARYQTPAMPALALLAGMGLGRARAWLLDSHGGVPAPAFSARR
jgi:hypothetical protein